MVAGGLSAVGTLACKVCSSVPLKLGTGDCSLATTKVGVSNGASILAPCAASGIVLIFAGSKSSLVESKDGSAGELSFVGTFSIEAFSCAAPVELITT